MPTYEYLCQTCNHRFETWQKMTDDPLTECPECGGHIRRVLFPAGIVFKGSGFYKTDHGSGALPAGHKDESSTESKPSSETKASTESSTSAASKSESTATAK